jgi:uncharacterized membrane protein HdeD (DUF308 family)
MIAVGILGVILPSVVGLAVAVLIGWLLIVSGILHLIFAWSAGRATAVIWEVLVGLVYLAIGFYILARPVVGLAGVTLGLGAYLFAEAILEFIQWLQLRTLPGGGWLLFDGIISLIIALMIWATWPSNIGWVLGTLVGVTMFVRGISRLAISLAVRRAVA